MNKRQTGAQFEKITAEFLMEQGYTILEMNYRCRTGEIDIVAKEDGYICFVEVKYRNGTDYGFPAEAIGGRKRLTIFNTARHFLLTHGYQDETPARFDAVLILGKELELIRNAYGGFQG
ncbi:YraN family protein [Parasporobacterium paucivorans]|uniref:UPF0102 protein SAMN02745691_00012 n=1 Tax=Parasporobacterium paucivorans DSM 15970 TaxID=1122934 RepID=A0A1M6A077_9FIRM|nr:YraN family protein [Parasporobacterium paucivorans]SHI29885.1 putative endonuclease [Parasporobacterium paucivorans DSM 15970]